MGAAPHVNRQLRPSRQHSPSGERTPQRPPPAFPPMPPTAAPSIHGTPRDTHCSAAIPEHAPARPGGTQPHTSHADASGALALALWKATPQPVASKCQGHVCCSRSGTQRPPRHLLQSPRGLLTPQCLSLSHLVQLVTCTTVQHSSLTHCILSVFALPTCENSTRRYWAAGFPLSLVVNSHGRPPRAQAALRCVYRWHCDTYMPLGRLWRSLIYRCASIPEGGSGLMLLCAFRAEAVASAVVMVELTVGQPQRATLPCSACKGHGSWAAHAAHCWEVALEVS